MDPLSVAASIVGLLAAGGKVTSLLFTVITQWRDAPALARSIMWEVTDISAALGHLQNFISGRTTASPERGSLILVDQLLTTLTGCVTTYSELHLILANLNVDEKSGVMDHIRWMRQEGTLVSLVQRLQGHKSSLMLMLTIVQCKSMEEAQSSTQRLHTLIEEVLESNRDLAERIRGLEREGSVISRARSTVLVLGDDCSIQGRDNSTPQPKDISVQKFTFEDDLNSSRVYNRAIYRFSQLSLSSTALYTTALSVFSKLSLSQVSSISFYALPLCAADLHDSHLYIFGDEGADLLHQQYPSTSEASKPKRPERKEDDIDPLLTRAIAADIARNSPKRDTAGPSEQAPKRGRLLGRFAAPQRRVVVSRPENPVHLTHVSYNEQDGQFCGLPREWQRLIRESENKAD